MISHHLLPASLYNDLPQIEGQAPIPDRVLAELGKIFLSYGMQNQLGVGLLHRHFDLDAGDVMVHEGLRCSPKNLGDDGTTFSGASFYLDGEHFRAFEYDTEKPLDLKGDFLKEVASYLTRKGLARQVALSKLDVEHVRLMETLEDQTKSHVCVSVPDYEVSLPDEVTEWRFDVSDDHQVRPVIARLCKKTQSGAHKRTK